jgi:oligopeptide transport system permease protein
MLLVSLTFLLLRFLPGGPFDHDTPLNPHVQAELEKSWNLDAPLGSQYLSYMGALLEHGELGVSMQRPDQSVREILLQGLGQTLSLNLITLFFIYVFAFALSLLWARYRDGSLGIALEQLFMSLVSLPSLFVAPLLIYVFGFYLNWLPIAFLSSPRHFILPVLALGLRPMAHLARILQKSFAHQFESEYIRGARARGLSETRILTHHILRNSLVPLLSYSGTMIVSLLSGSFLIEMLFAIPGLGSEFISSLAERDYTVICGLALFYGVLLIGINLVLDFLMREADPRLKDPA